MMLKKFVKKIVGFCLVVIYILSINISSSESYDKDLATALLEERYRPFITLTDAPMKLRVPEYISSSEDLAKLLEAIMTKRAAGKLYEEWFTE